MFVPTFGWYIQKRFYLPDYCQEKKQNTDNDLQEWKVNKYIYLKIDNINPKL